MRNKALVVYAIFFAGITAAGIVTYRRVHDAAELAQQRLDEEKVRAEYLERAGWMRSNPEEHAYHDDLKPFFRDYFAQVEEVQKRYNLNTKFDDYLRSLPGRAEKGLADATVSKALYEKVHHTFAALHEGTYAPALTATDHGLRLDVLPAELRQDKGGQVVFPLVLWGAQRELREDHSTRTQRAVALVGFDAVWKLMDATGKFIGEVRVGDPSMRIDYPERFIAFFPPQMVLGEYKLDRVPAEAEKAQLTVEIAARASWGSAEKATFTFTFPVQREWKLGPGEAWQGAEVSERPEEEINSGTKGK